MKLKLTLTIDAHKAMTEGVASATSGMYLTDGGDIVVPLDLGNGYVVNRPSACGTWELVDDGE